MVAAILGEIPPQEGRVTVKGRKAFVSQNPAIFPCSLKRNIIFDYGINSEWYETVVKMCHLEEDFEHFPNGDETLADNVELTAGQRAKICIARAIYSNADVYIFDDPLHSRKPIIDYKL